MEKPKITIIKLSFKNNLEAHHINLLKTHFTETVKFREYIYKNYVNGVCSS